MKSFKEFLYESKYKDIINQAMKYEKQAQGYYNQSIEKWIDIAKDNINLVPKELKSLINFCLKAVNKSDGFITFKAKYPINNIMNYAQKIAKEAGKKIEYAGKIINFDNIEKDNIILNGSITNYIFDTPSGSLSIKTGEYKSDKPIINFSLKNSNFMNAYMILNMIKK